MSDDSGIMRFAMNRRSLVGGAVVVAVAAFLPQGAQAMEEIDPEAPAFGMIGQLKAVPGQRDALIACLLDGSADMPGNLAYLVNRDARDADAVWVVEIWKDAASHAASLALPQVKAAIAKARPILAGFGTSAEIVPVTGGRH